MTIKIRKISVADEQQSLGSHSPYRTKSRPVSPHIQIYKWEFTMFYSILHRASAVGIGVIALLLVGIVLGLAFLPIVTYIIWFFNSFFGVIFISLSAFVVGYYIFATMKYILWSTVKGLSMRTARMLGHLSFVATIVFTIGVTYLWLL